MKLEKTVHCLKTELPSQHLPTTGHLRFNLAVTNLGATMLVKQIITSMGLLLFLVGCNQTLGSSPMGSLEAAATDPAALSAVTFSDVKEKVFVPHCLKCHATDTQKGDIDLEQFETAFAAAAMIREEVAADRMPRRAPPLPAELKALLFAWIDAGAPEK